jgi:hypothetical protein
VLVHTYTCPEEDKCRTASSLTIDVPVTWFKDLLTKVQIINHRDLWLKRYASGRPVRFWLIVINLLTWHKTW